MMEYIPGHTFDEIREVVLDRFGIEMTLTAIRSYKVNHKINSGTPCGRPKGHPTKQFPEKIGRYIHGNYKGVGPREMAERLNSSFGTVYTTRQINTYYKNHGLNSGLTGRFEKGHTPANKGKKILNPHPASVATQFQKGHTPANKLPIGTVRERSDGYLRRKIGEGAREWRQEHLIVWEEAHGPIPEGGIVTFLDGDHHNVSLDNLRLIDRDINLNLNRRKLRTEDTGLNETAILIARLSSKTFKRSKK